MTTATRKQPNRPTGGVADARPARSRFTISGVVQGVGFRPFVHHLATELQLTGFVGNDALCVFAEVQGAPAALAEFERRLRLDAPPMAIITSIARQWLAPSGESGFTIVASAPAAGARTLVCPDVAPCGKCLDELFDPDDRRYRHAFISCTDCGPRFTIIRDLPYDRPATTMAEFAMCARCAEEYVDPLDRRFHAQPIACRDCGPRLWFDSGGVRIEGTDAAIAAAQRAIVDGLIVAIKGIGGYHLACRADDPDAIGRLRARKSRDQKPFALLVRDLAVAGRLARIDADEQRVLTDRARPIVLLRRREDAALDIGVAPGNPLLGVMLPYSPLHHLLLARVPGSRLDPPDVLVMTSANISDEPLCFDDLDAQSRLPLLADAVLTHDRGIHVPCDDSVVRVVGGQELPIRRSRGYAPLPISLGHPLAPTLAVGAELKGTCCLIDGANAFCSAHIGDMGSLETMRAFERAVGQLCALHCVEPEVVAADAHPAYLTRRWAEERTGGPSGPAVHLVQHHHAHVAALLAEHGRLGEPMLGVAFDGTGYGDDGTIWGGEFLLVGTDSTRYARVGHLRTVALPGGDAAVRNPCRMALAYLAASEVAWEADLAPVAACDRSELAAVAGQLRSGLASVPCSSVGRLFDAVAALLGVRQRVAYEAQAAIEVEILAETRMPTPDTSAWVPDVPPWSFALGEDGVLDYGPVIRGIVDGLRSGVAREVLAYWFHVSLAQAVVTSAQRALRATDVSLVGLTGGVFQNALLQLECQRGLQKLGLEVLTHRAVPPNDGGLALGQAVIAALARASSGSIEN